MNLFFKLKTFNDISQGSFWNFLKKSFIVYCPWYFSFPNLFLLPITHSLWSLFLRHCMNCSKFIKMNFNFFCLIKPTNIPFHNKAPSGTKSLLILVLFYFQSSYFILLACLFFYVGVSSTKMLHVKVTIHPFLCCYFAFIFVQVLNFP